MKYKDIRGCSFMNDSDKKNLKKAIELVASHEIDNFEVGTINGLKQIHKYIFEDVFSFAGLIRDKNMSK